MLELLAISPIGLLVLAPLLGRVWQDRRREAALTVRAQVHQAVRKALGGESYVSIAVDAPTPWRAGRVRLSAPTGWECLIDQVTTDVLASMPRTYELVLRPGRRPAIARPRPRSLPAAA